MMHGIDGGFDAALCERVKKIDSNIYTVATHIGDAGEVFSKNPNIVTRQMQAVAAEALKNKDKCTLNIPEHFKMEIYFKEHKAAKRAAYYNGVSRISDNIIVFDTDDYFELLKAYMFII